MHWNSRWQKLTAAKVVFWSVKAHAIRSGRRPYWRTKTFITCALLTCNASAREASNGARKDLHSPSHWKGGDSGFSRGEWLVFPKWRPVVLFTWEEKSFYSDRAAQYDDYSKLRRQTEELLHVSFAVLKTLKVVFQVVLGALIYSAWSFLLQQIDEIEKKFFVRWCHDFIFLLFRKKKQMTMCSIKIRPSIKMTAIIITLCRNKKKQFFAASCFVYCIVKLILMQVGLVRPAVAECCRVFCSV